MSVSASQVTVGGDGASEQHVLVVYRPLAAAVGLQLIVRVPLRDDGSVRVGVAEQGPPPHRFAPAQRRRRRMSGVGGGVGARERVVSRLGR